MILVSDLHFVSFLIIFLFDSNDAEISHHAFGFLHQFLVFDQSLNRFLEILDLLVNSLSVQVIFEAFIIFVVGLSISSRPSGSINPSAFACQRLTFEESIKISLQILPCGWMSFEDDSSFGIQEQDVRHSLNSKNLTAV